MRIERGYSDDRIRMPDLMDVDKMMLIQTDIDGEIISLYEGGNNDRGYLNNELRGKNLKDLFELNDESRIINALAETQQNNQYESEYEFEYGTGQKEHLSGRFLKLDGKGIMCLFRLIASEDINEKTSYSDHSLIDIVEHMSEVLYELDKNGICKYISPSIEKMLGYRQDEVIGRNFSGFVIDIDNILQERESFFSKSGEFATDLQILTKEGDHRWIRVSAKGKFSDGNFTGSIGTFIDVTDHKKNELAIEASEKKYRILAENISDVIWVYNHTLGKFTYMSPSVLQFRGLKAEQVMDRKIEDGLSAESAEQIKRTIAEAIDDNNQLETNAKKTFLHEIQIQTASGDLMWIETSTHYEITEKGEIEIIGVSRNIDERKKSELRLREYARELKTSEELFFSVFNESPVSMILSDPDSKVILDVNKKLASTLGMKREDLVQKEFFSLGLDLHDSKALELGKILAMGSPVRDYEVSVTTPKGAKLYFLLTVERIRISDEYRLLTTAVDITDRKKGEERISNMLDQEKLLADISQILNQPGDIKALITDVLRRVGEQINASRVFIYELFDGGKILRSTYEWIHEDYIENNKELETMFYQSIAAWKNLVSGSIINIYDFHELPEEIYSLTDQYGLKSLLGYQLMFENEIVGFIGFAEYRQNRKWFPDEIDLLRIVSGIISNALQRSSIIDQLEFSNTRLNLAIDSANEGLWDIDFENDHVYNSDRCLTMLGFEPGELEVEFSKLWNYTHPEDRNRIREAFDKHLRGETEVYNAIYRLRTRDNNWKWILDHGQVVKKSPDGRPLRFMGTRLDINEQKETELKLKQLVETQDKLFSIIAHDLRGPIGSFSQGIELITSETVKDENLRKRLLEELKKTSQTTYRLLENLLNWSITKSNTMSVEPEPLRLKQLIEENLKLLAAYTLQKSIDIAVEADDRIMAYADRDSVNLVLRNLLNNAVKFTPSRGLVKVSAHDTGQQVELQVDDTGVGMSKEILENLFKLNNYNSTLGTNMEKGAGIGLVLCKDIVERNGGTIWAESIPGSGSSFKFTLPKYA